MHMRERLARIIHDPVTALFVIAALFAAGSVGFFIAIAVQQKSASEQMAAKSLTDAEKTAVMRSLDVSLDTQGQVATERGNALTTQQKLDILNSLNAQ